VIKDKMCSECHEIKPIYEFDITPSGKKREATCRNCINKQFQPKQKPKIVGQGKPIFGFGGTTCQEDMEIGIYEKEGEVMHKEIYEWVSEYVRSKGDGFTAKEFSKHYGISPNNVYYKFDKLVKENLLFKAGGEVLRYFLIKENYEYYQKNKGNGRRKDAINKELLEEIKNKDRIPPKEKETKEPTAEPVAVHYGEIKEDGSKMVKTIKQPKKEMNIADAINTLIEIKIEKEVEITVTKIIDKKIKELKKDIINDIEKELKEIKSGLNDIDDKIDTTKIAQEVIQIMKKKMME
jgi:hypothetical protein